VEDVQPAVDFLGEGHHALYVRGPGDVRVHECGGATGLFQHADRLVAALVIHIGHHYGGAFAPQGQGSGPADARAGARDEGYFAFGVHAMAPSSVH